MHAQHREEPLSRSGETDKQSLGFEKLPPVAQIHVLGAFLLVGVFPPPREFQTGEKRSLHNGKKKQEVEGGGYL